MDKSFNRKTDITSRAMLVAFSVSQWTAHKRDKAVSAEVAGMKGAKREAGNYNKVLIGKGALSRIQAVVTAARNDHAFLSAPWMQDGTRILPVATFESYSAKMRAHKEAFDAAVNEFVENYDSYIEQARETLGALFDWEDYPMKQEIRKKFQWGIAVMPVPSADDFRVDLDAATVDAMQRDMQAHFDAAVKTATGDAFTRLHGVARAMADKLAAYDPAAGKQGNPFRDSLVENVRELLEVLPALNLSQDARLDSLITAAHDKLANHAPDDLRQDAALRAETAKEAAAIADQIADVMGFF